MSFLNIFPLVLLPFSPVSQEKKENAAIAKAEQTYSQVTVQCVKNPEAENYSNIVFEFNVQDIKQTLEDGFAQVAHSKSFKVEPLKNGSEYGIRIYTGDYNIDLPVPRLLPNQRIQLASFSKRSTPIQLTCFAFHNG